MFDPNSKGYARYHGLKWFPVDSRYRFDLPLTANPNPDTIVILSTRGNQRHAVRAGWFDFRVGAKPCRLEATRLLEPGVGENDLGVFFRDATTGRESYGLGRYVDAKRAADGRYVLDYYNCPIPPRANRLSVAIRAGEMDSHYH